MVGLVPLVVDYVPAWKYRRVLKWVAIPCVYAFREILGMPQPHKLVWGIIAVESLPKMLPCGSKNTRYTSCEDGDCTPQYPHNSQILTILPTIPSFFGWLVKPPFLDVENQHLQHPWGSLLGVLQPPAEIHHRSSGRAAQRAAAQRWQGHLGRAGHLVVGSVRPW